MKLSRAFTIIELIFVIVVLGILATVALPKFGKTKELADIAKGRADIATIRAAIVNERQTRLILGDDSYITVLSPAGATTLFTGDGAGKLLLTYGMKAGTSSGNWSMTSGTVYTYYIGTSQNTFTYYPNDNGKFLCTAGTECSKLVD